jgi:Uma2 family endonuclease
MTALATASSGTTPEACEARDVFYEMVNGQVVELPPMGSYPTWLASVLHEYLAPFSRAHQLGRVVTEMLFRIDQASNLQRRPDVAFVSYERWPRERRVPRKSPWEVVPELTIEVVSTSDQAYEVVAKIREYFQAGVRRVWVVFPDEYLVYDYESPTRVRILPRGDDLEAERLLPGFRLPLTTLFEDEAEAP